MKKNLLICAVLMTAMIVSPLTAIDRQRTVKPQDKIQAEDTGIVSVMLSENGKVEKMDEREYVIGALCAEMDLSCHEEALKAQAVACYTYMLYRKNNVDAENFNGADLSDNPSECQGYLNIEARKKKWGDDYEKNEKYAEKIADSVLGKKIIYNGEPILAAYHELNSGTTESASDVWGRDIPYLQQIGSAGDRLSTDYSKTVVMSLSEFMSCAIKIKGVELSDDYNDWLGKSDKTESGYVKSIVLGGKTVSGNDFRKAFGLNSCNFTVSCENEKFTIKTLGKGHMVGMSQYGADYMARQGSTYDEILRHYYKNTKIV